MGTYFTGEFHGPVALWLEIGLKKYMELYNKDIHYGKAIIVLQSSGTGKSRAVAELAKLVSRDPLQKFTVPHLVSEF